MSLSTHIPCQIELKPVGWWLSFPGVLDMGLLLTEPAEKTEFARDCGIDLDPSEFAADWFFKAISSCPPYWYRKAKTFRSPNF